jgi:DNA-binding XRE family transcriptional regulator
MKKETLYSLKELRAERGLSQQRVASEIGIPYGTYQAIESGRGKGFNILTKKKIADFFGVPILSVFPEEYQLLKAIVEQHQQVKKHTEKRGRHEKPKTK